MRAHARQGIATVTAPDFRPRRVLHRLRIRGHDRRCHGCRADRLDRPAGSSSSPDAPTSLPAWHPGRPGLRADLRPIRATRWCWSATTSSFSPSSATPTSSTRSRRSPIGASGPSKAACFITEVWSDMLPGYLLELLTGFDHIFLGCAHSVEDVARMTGRPCSYLPLAADVPRFAPASLDQPRPIDVCYIGRRSQVTHQALLRGTPSGGSSSTTTTPWRRAAATSSTARFASTARTSIAACWRHYSSAAATSSPIAAIVNRPEFTAGRDEISPRFYEGAAAGTVMLGEAPRSDEFKRQFDWPDAVIPLPFDSPDVGRMLADLDADPERLRAVRRNNVARPPSGTTGCIEFRWCSIPSGCRIPMRCWLARKCSIRSQRRCRCHDDPARAPGATLHQWRADADPRVSDATWR